MTPAERQSYANAAEGQPRDAALISRVLAKELVSDQLSATMGRLPSRAIELQGSGPELRYRAESAGDAPTEIRVRVETSAGRFRAVLA